MSKRIGSLEDGQWYDGRLPRTSCLLIVHRTRDSEMARNAIALTPEKRVLVA